MRTMKIICQDKITVLHHNGKTPIRIRPCYRGRKYYYNRSLFGKVNCYVLECEDFYIGEFKSREQAESVLNRLNSAFDNGAGKFHIPADGEE